MKKKVLVKLQGSTLYKTHAEIDFSKIKNILVFPNDVFFEIDNLKVAIKKEDWNDIQKEITENKK